MSTPAATPVPVLPTSAGTGSAQPSPGRSAENVSLAPKQLKFAGTYSISDGGVYIASERGYFAEQGLDVEYTQVAIPAETIPALATEQVAAGGIPISAGTLNAAARGVGLRIVADKGSLLPGFGYSAVLVRKDLVDSGRVREGADLKGLSIVTAQPVDGNAAAPVLARLLQQSGLTEAELKEVRALSFPDMNVALGGQAVDVAFQVEPLVRAAVVQGIAVRWKGYEDIYPGQQSAVIGYGPLITTRDPDLGRRFMTGYLKGARDYYRAFTTGVGKPEIIDIVAKNSSLSPAVLQEVVPAGVNPDGFVNVDSVTADQEFFVEKGAMPARVDVGQLVDHSYVEAALRALGPYPGN
jgi:NitT/TauT family transport system substrate-binding protein